MKIYSKIFALSALALAIPLMISAQPAAGAAHASPGTVTRWRANDPAPFPSFTVRPIYGSRTLEAIAQSHPKPRQPRRGTSFGIMLPAWRKTRKAIPKPGSRSSPSAIRRFWRFSLPSRSKSPPKRFSTFLSIPQGWVPDAPPMTCRPQRPMSPDAMMGAPEGGPNGYAAGANGSPASPQMAPMPPIRRARQARTSFREWISRMSSA